ncbi:hypothetical protein [Mesobacillus maritimus]|uniref:hypothetical protein n=1 Tax=Mesobacillus maritimus TaxID=1643336 RepID=UPI00384D36DB
MKKWGVTSVVLVLVIVLTVYYFNTKEVYGNDRDSIEKVIYSIEGYEDQQIEILDIQDFNDYRFVGFLSNNHPSYVEFYKNHKGNYEWRHIETDSNDSLGFFLPFIHDDLNMMVVTNYENEIAKIQIDVNGESVEQEFTPLNASVTWIELPQSDSRDYEFKNYRYYDNDGHLIFGE